MSSRLHFSIYRKWFDEILSGDKTIEYREVKPHYDRIFNRHYDEVKFVNGYGSERPYLIAEVTKITKSEQYYEIHLGKIKETGNLW